MGCNCGGTKTTPSQYVYTGPDGKQTVYRTEVEARAAQIRDARTKGTAGTYKPK